MDNEIEKDVKTILIVDDEQPIVDILVYNLEKEGYRTIEASDGLTAIDMAQEQKPDLILLDIMLPKIDGYGVCEVIRKKSQVPIFIEVRMGSLRSKIRILTSMTLIKTIMTSKMTLKLDYRN